MNAGRDVERLIAGWLVEEAQAGAPDRVLDSARRSIDRTRQRRFVVAWREPVYITPLRLAGMAAVLAVAFVGAAYFGRVTAPSGGVGGQPSPSPSAAAEVTLASYRAARNEICTRYGAELNPLKSQLDGIYDPETPAAARAASIETLTRYATRADAAIAELDALPVPATVAADHHTNVARMQDGSSLIHQELALLAAGDLAGAQALDLATDPLSRQIEAFESKYGLAACP